MGNKKKNSFARTFRRLRKYGLVVGNQRITPAGLLTALILFVALIAVIVILVIPHGGGTPDNVTGYRVENTGTAGSYTASQTGIPLVNTLNEGYPSGLEDTDETDAEENEPTVMPTAVITPEPKVTSTPAPERKSVTIRSLGEIAIQDNLLKSAQQSDGTYDFSAMFSYIRDVMGSADYTIADVEGSLGGTTTASGTGLLVTPPSLLDALYECGVDMLTVANDHALDGYYADLKAALQNIRDAGMEYVGGALSKEEKNTAKVIDINGINVGFVAYTESLNGMEKKSHADATNFGVNLITAAINPKADVKACKDAGADVVIAYVSWGEMLNRKSTKNQQMIAKALVEAGVDVIIGYNPHVVQPAAWLERNGHRTLCLCSAGNFLSDSREQYSDSGVIFQFTISQKADYSGYEITDPQYIPTYVWRVDNGAGQPYSYYTVPVGVYYEEAPDGMDTAQVTRMKTVWKEIAAIMGSTVATETAE